MVLGGQSLVLGLVARVDTRVAAVASSAGAITAIDRAVSERYG